MTPVDPELWLLERLKHHGIDVYAGGQYTTLKDRIRRSILANDWGPVTCGRRDKRAESFEEAYERLYGEPLGQLRKSGGAR